MKVCFGQMRSFLLVAWPVTSFHFLLKSFIGRLVIVSQSWPGRNYCLYSNLACCFLLPFYKFTKWLIPVGIQNGAGKQKKCIICKNWMQVKTHKQISWPPAFSTRPPTESPQRPMLLQFASGNARYHSSRNCPELGHISSSSWLTMITTFSKSNIDRIPKGSQHMTRYYQLKPCLNDFFPYNKTVTN